MLPKADHRPGMVNEPLKQSLKQPVQGRMIRGINQLGVSLAQSFHHHPRIDFENLPGALDPDHVDRREPDIDGFRGADRDLDAGLPNFSFVQQRRVRSRIEVMTPVQQAPSSSA